MLAELEAIAGRTGGEAMARDLRGAARTLLERQFVFADDPQGGQRRWEMIRRHRELLSDVFDVLGFDLFVDDREQSAGLTSQSGASIRRMSINETLFLVGLRVIYEQRLREFSLKEGGRCEALLSEVWELIEERTGRQRPSQPKCRLLADTFRRQGLLREAGDMPNGDMSMEIRPVIARVVNEATLESLERYAAAGLVPVKTEPEPDAESDGDEVDDQAEEQAA